MDSEQRDDPQRPEPVGAFYDALQDLFDLDGMGVFGRLSTYAATRKEPVTLRPSTVRGWLKNRRTPPASDQLTAMVEYFGKRTILTEDASRQLRSLWEAASRHKNATRPARPPSPAANRQRQGRARFNGRAGWIAAVLAAAAIPALLVFFLLGTLTRSPARAKPFALATTSRPATTPPPSKTASPTDPTPPRTPLATQPMPLAPHSGPSTTTRRPRQGSRQEVERVHPLDKSDPATADDHMTIVKYYDAHDGAYQVCVTSYHNPLHVGSWNTEVDWSDHVGSPLIPLPGNGKTNCTASRPQRTTFVNVVYAYGNRHWFADMT